MTNEERAESARKVLDYFCEIVENDDETEILATCLLYTSPSPRDVEESRMPSSA